MVIIFLFFFFFLKHKHTITTISLLFCSAQHYKNRPNVTAVKNKTWKCPHKLAQFGNPSIECYLYTGNKSFLGCLNTTLLHSVNTIILSTITIHFIKRSISFKMSPCSVWSTWNERERKKKDPTYRGRDNISYRTSTYGCDTDSRGEGDHQEITCLFYRRLHSCMARLFSQPFPPTFHT